LCRLSAAAAAAAAAVNRSAVLIYHPKTAATATVVVVAAAAVNHSAAIIYYPKTATVVVVVATAAAAVAVTGAAVNHSAVPIYHPVVVAVRHCSTQATQVKHKVKVILMAVLPQTQLQQEPVADHIVVRGQIICLVSTSAVAARTMDYGALFFKKGLTMITKHHTAAAAAAAAAGKVIAISISHPEAAPTLM
jgi:hypothetical protein